MVELFIAPWALSHCLKGMLCRQLWLALLIQQTCASPVRIACVLARATASSVLICEMSRFCQLGCGDGPCIWKHASGAVQCAVCQACLCMRAGAVGDGG